MTRAVKAEHSLEDLPFVQVSPSWAAENQLGALQAAIPCCDAHCLPVLQTTCLARQAVRLMLCYCCCACRTTPRSSLTLRSMLRR